MGRRWEHDEPLTETRKAELLRVLSEWKESLERWLPENITDEKIAALVSSHSERCIELRSSGGCLQALRRHLSDLVNADHWIPRTRLESKWLSEQPLCKQLEEPYWKIEKLIKAFEKREAKRKYRRETKRLVLFIQSKKPRADESKL